MADVENQEGSNAQGEGQNELAKLRARAERFEGMTRDLEKKLERYKNIDPDKYKATLEELENLSKAQAEKDPAENEKRWEKKEKELRAQLGKELDEHKTASERMAAELKTLRVTDKVMLEIGGLFNDDARRFIKMEIERAGDLEDGDIIFKDEKGHVIYGQNGLPISVKEFGEKLAKDYPSLAKPTGIGGTKKEGEKVAHRGGLPKTFREMSALAPALHKQAYDALSLDEKKSYLRDMKAAERSSAGK
jgi:hypothetical protein